MRKVRGRVSPVATLGLIVVWMLLRGDVSIGSLAFGLVIALAVQLLFPLPEIPEMRTIHPLGAATLILSTLGGLVSASVAVAWQVLAFWRPTRNAVIAVPLRTDSEFIATIAAELITLVPGSVAVESDAGCIIVHVFDAQTPRRIERARESVRRVEARVIRAFGTESQLADLRQET